MEIEDGPINLPMKIVGRRVDPVAERTFYVARPGFAALPSGTLTILAFVSPQLFSLTFLLWAIWWPTPSTPGTYRFALIGTGAILLLSLLVFWMLMRRFPGYLLAILRTPFIRLTVTDRRVIWSVPWTRVPLMELDRRRVMGSILGAVDKRGRGNAAMMLMPGDPAADIDGNIHFDRLPQVERFVESLARW